VTAGPVTPIAAEAGRPPVWVWPSIALGLLYPSLARSARLDVDLLGRLPEPPTNLRSLPNAYTVILVGATVAVAVAFSLLRLGITDIYTESMAFMIIALAIGIASPAAGFLLVLLHIPFDLIAASSSFPELEPFLPALAGRAVSWWLLWLLVVAIPLMARALPGATLASGQPADRLIRTVLAYAAGAVAIGVLLFMWVAAMPFVIRPVFTWTAASVPTTPAIYPLQTSGQFIVVAGVALLLAVTAVRHRFGALDQEAVELDDPDQLGGIEDEPLVSDQLEFAGRVAVHALTVIVLGGLVSGALDVVLLFGAALVGQLLAGRLSQSTALGAQLARIPWLVRFVGGFVLSYVVGLVINNFTFEPAFGSEFFPLVLTAAIGLAIFQVLLGATAPASAEPEAATDSVSEETDPGAPVATGAGMAALAAALLSATVLAIGALFALPTPVAADNCSSWGDCPATMEAVAAAGAGAAAVAALGAGLAAMRLDQQSKQDRKRRRRRRRGPGPHEPAPQAGSSSLLDRLRERAMRNYGAPAAGTIPPARGEMKLGEQDPFAGKGEMKLGEQDPFAGKGEMKLGEQDPFAGKGEMKLGE
jgi:hypothetical protein